MEKDIREIPLSQIDTFPNHPFQVKDDDDMMNLVESIAQNGLFSPIILRKTFHKRFEVVSGHRRLRAYELLGRDTIPAEVLNITKEEATLYMIDSNLQRSSILPSEKAFAYKMRMEAIKEYKWRMNAGRVPERDFEVIGKLSDAPGATELPPEGKSKDRLAEAIGVSHETIRRYIRLTELIPELLNLVDEGKLGLRTGVELSYINKGKQMEIFNIISMDEVYPTHAQAIRMRKLDEQGNLAKGVVGQIMLEQKPNQKEKVSFNMARFEKLFPKNLPASRREDYIAAAMEHYARYLQRKERGQER